MSRFYNCSPLNYGCMPGQCHSLLLTMHQLYLASLQVKTHKI